MNASMLFVIIALGIALGVAVILLWVLLREKEPVTQASQAKANAKVYRDQISDLDREHDSGHISDEEWQQSRDELSLRLLEDTSAVDDPAAKAEKPAIWTAVVLEGLLACAWFSCPTHEFLATGYFQVVAQQLFLCFQQHHC